MSLVSRLVSAGGNPSVPEVNHVVYFTRYERTGVTVMAVAGVLSCAFVSLLLFYIIITALLQWSRGSKEPSAFTSKQIAVFLTCLLVSDLIQSISGTTQVKWAIENRIYDGPSCSIQAATLLMGDLASTVWSCVIAANTFCGIALRKQWPRSVVWATVVIGWLFVIILTFIIPLALTTPSRGPFFSIAGTWCFISSSYAVPRLVIHYVPLFIAAALIFVLYGLIFLVLRGNISFIPSQIEGGTHGSNEVSRQRVIIAKRMLWYPVAYVTCIMPIAITRIVGLQEENVPEAVWIWTMFFLFALGAVDTVIYATTRKVIKPIKWPLHMATFRDSSSSRSEPAPPDASQSSDRFFVIDKRPSEEIDLEEAFHIHRVEDEPGKAGVHVTFERIQEVM